MEIVLHEKTLRGVDQRHRNVERDGHKLIAEEKVAEEGQPNIDKEAFMQSDVPRFLNDHHRH